jgi:hypothetical protein
MDAAALSVVIDKLAWPFVAVLAIIILGPMGLLQRLVDSIAQNIGSLSRAVADFKETVLTIRPELELLSRRSNEISQTFRDSTVEIEGRITAVKTELADISRHITGALPELREHVTSLQAESADISRKVSVMLRQIAAGDTDVNESLEGEDAGAPVRSSNTAELMLTNIRKSWHDFVDVLRGISGDPAGFDARMVGSLAYYMADGRRKGAIPRDLAEEIASLHSRYKRWMRMQSTKEDWLTEPLYDAFDKSILDVQARVRNIQLKAPRAPRRAKTNNAPSKAQATRKGRAPARMVP